MVEASEITAVDTVLEVGGGLGVLSEYLAPRVNYLHVVEIDQSLEPALESALSRFANVTVHYEDAVKMSFDTLEPQPTKLVANLPYGVAATVLIRVLQEIPAVQQQVAMVQREVGERFTAQPGSRQYGVTSVLVQLMSRVEVVRPVARTVFYPVPNVDSVIVRFVRGERQVLSPGLVSFIRAAFAHRRKKLFRSLKLAGFTVELADLTTALAELGYGADIRAEVLKPNEFAALYRWVSK